MVHKRFLPFLFLLTISVYGQIPSWMPNPTQQQTYTLHRSSSRESTGANADYRTLTPGQTMTILDADGPGEISHIWFTLDDPEPYHLKRIVLRMYWDGEKSPSVETPIGDFFGLGNGIYYAWESAVLSVGRDRSLNSYFPMPYAKHARVTITNEGKQSLTHLYWNIDYRVNAQPLPPHTLYFHAQYRQAQPNHGWTGEWYENGDPMVNYRRNLDGKDNYVWMEAQGHGQFVGVTMSILQNQDGWWGEGDDMFFIDDPSKPAIIGTGAEDYFLGAWGFGGPSDLMLHGAPVVGKELAGGRSSVYRFHLDSPIPFTKSFKATIEHGNANHRSDNFYSVAYWYQAEPHMAFPPLPDVDDRIPTLEFVGGPGNSKGQYSPGSLQPR
ncbi:MAG: DUF2961 domain-containing protein [Acidobacteria bacterium]|uniref:DUF2961 family protein n=2 Tax=Acidipila rosea TaxID=768535 RepID=A0A4R1L273_9BACT|nr:DUF2961 domain-containing protein [Acidobacteriota bacterium]TCK72098.1 hypothetical protein C7378_2731 [Acidipila rosea]